MRGLVIEDLVERAERENQHQAKPSDKGERFLLSDHRFAPLQKTFRRCRSLFFDQPQRVAGWVAHQDSSLESELSLRVLRYGHRLGRDELRARLAQSLGER